MRVSQESAAKERSIRTHYSIMHFGQAYLDSLALQIWHAARFCGGMMCEGSRRVVEQIRGRKLKFEFDDGDHLLQIRLAPRCHAATLRGILTRKGRQVGLDKTYIIARLSRPAVVLSPSLVLQ